MLGSHTVIDSALARPADGSNLAVVGAVDADRNGLDDAFVVLHRGAADDFLGLFSLVDGQVTQLRGPRARRRRTDGSTAGA